MKEIRIQYKCRQCGGIDNSLCMGGSDENQFIVRRDILDILCRNKLRPGNQLQLTTLHLCPNGIGVADLIGYIVVERGEI